MSRRNNRAQLAQNFLVDDRVIAGVVGTLHPPPGSTVLDLGAGAGALTEHAARLGAHVIAVERDPRWVSHLRAHAPGWGSVEVAQGDILSIALPREPYLVLSNAPFNVGTALVRRLLTEAHGLVRAVLVLQRETARRLAGRPRCGRFAATWAPWFELRVQDPIPARAFRPVPNVDAAVLSLTPRAVPLLSPAAYREYDAFLGAVFSGRDSTVTERIARRFGRARARAAAAAAGLDRAATPSGLRPETYALLFGAATPRP
jgi:23S rRNA (adenine-N6)-dimethyltransferase